jgi:hypothetical protein
MEAMQIFYIDNIFIEWDDRVEKQTCWVVVDKEQEKERGLPSTQGSVLINSIILAV